MELSKLIIVLIAALAISGCASIKASVCDQFDVMCEDKDESSSDKD